MKYCGVIYLLYMAFQVLRERGALAIDPRLDARSLRRVVVTGFLINILNPKLSIFFLAFLPQFIGADEARPLLLMLELSGTFMAMTFAVFVLYGLFAAAVRDRIVTRPKVMTGCAAALPAVLPRWAPGWRLPNDKGRPRMAQKSKRRAQGPPSSDIILPWPGARAELGPHPGLKVTSSWLSSPSSPFSPSSLS